MLVNAQLLAEGWNSPRATVCMHLAPDRLASASTSSASAASRAASRARRRASSSTSSTRPPTHDDPVVTLHSLLDRDVYRGGAIVVGPVRRGRGRRLRVERRVLPVTADPERRAQVFERELWRIAVENLRWGEQHVWAPLAGARVASNNWRRAKAMLHFDSTGELRRRFLVTCLQRNRNSQLRIRALGEIGGLRDAEAFDEAVEIVGGWSRDERREGVKVLLQALAEKPIGRRDQAARWIWHLAEYTREVHEEYAVQRWPETKRLLGLLVNSSGGAHARNARRLVQAARKQDRRLAAALLAAALAHTPEAQRCSTAPARGWRASRPRSRASCCATSRRAGAAAAAGAAGRRAAGEPRRRPSAEGAGDAEAKRRARRATSETDRARTEDATAATTSTDAAERPSPSDRRSAQRESSSAAGGPRRRRAPRCPAPVSTSSAPASSMPAAVPSPSVPATGAAGARRAPARPRARRRGRGEPAVERASSAPSTASRSAPRPPAPATSRSPPAPAGTRRCATFSPMPSTAQPSCGRPSTRIPATFLPSIQTSLGHLISASQPAALRRRPPPRAAAAARRARAAPRTSAAPLPAARSTPAPAARARAVCSSAVTSVPCGAPARASSFARSLVESVSRWWTRGRPIIAAAAAPRRPGSARARPRRRRG